MTATPMSTEIYSMAKSETDCYAIVIELVSTGELLGVWTGEIEGGSRPVASLVFSRKGSETGAVSFDNIQIVQDAPPAD